MKKQLPGSAATAMPEPTQDSAVQSAVAGWLYDLALDPAGIEKMIDAWDVHLYDLRRAANFYDPRVLDDLTTRQHYDRADKIMQRLGDHPDSIADEVGLYGPVPAYVVNKTLNVLSRNEAAQTSAAYSATNDLPVHKEDLETVSKAVRDVLGATGAAATTLRVQAKRSDRVTLLHVRKAATQSDEPLAIIASNEIAWPKGFGTRLRVTFDLTPSEIEVVRGLLEYGALGDIASTRRRSVGTIRNQVKSILAKTDTRSQVELVRLVMSLMRVEETITPAGPEPYRPPTMPQHLQPVPFQSLLLENKRRIDYIVVGDPDGYPVLHFSGDFAFFRCARHIEHAMAERGLKFITPMRPGYADSSLPSKGASYDDTLVDDFIAIANHEGAARFGIYSAGADSYYALMIAQKCPGRVACIFALAGALPFTRAAQIERMERWHRFVISAGRYVPHLTPMLLRACFAMARRMGAKKFLQTVFGSSPADLAILERPEAFEALAAGSSIMLSGKRNVETAFSHMITDRQQVDWTSLARTVTASLPVHFWNGAQDPHLPPDTLREFREDFPDAHFRFFEDKGCFLFFDLWKELFDALYEALDAPSSADTG